MGTRQETLALPSRWKLGTTATKHRHLKPTAQLSGVASVLEFWRVSYSEPLGRAAWSRGLFCWPAAVGCPDQMPPLNPDSVTRLPHHPNGSAQLLSITERLSLFLMLGRWLALMERFTPASGWSGIQKTHGSKNGWRWPSTIAVVSSSVLLALMPLALRRESLPSDGQELRAVK
jgi:hypothetical protein